MIVSSSAIRTRPEIAPPPFRRRRRAGRAPGELVAHERRARSSGRARRAASGAGPAPRSVTVSTMPAAVARRARPRSGRRRARPRSENSSQKTSASAVAWSPRSGTGCSRHAPGGRRGRFPASPAAARSGPRSRRRRRRDDVSRSCTSAIEQIRFTLSRSAFSAAGSSAAPSCRRSSEATVCRLFLTRWWISWASSPRSAVRAVSTAAAPWWATVASSESSSGAHVRGCVAEHHQRPDPALLPAQRLRGGRSRSRTARCRPARSARPRRSRRWPSGRRPPGPRRSRARRAHSCARSARHVLAAMSRSTSSR